LAIANNKQDWFKIINLINLSKKSQKLTVLASKVSKENGE
jgi:hypothetical protein